MSLGLHKRVGELEGSTLIGRFDHTDYAVEQDIAKNAENHTNSKSTKPFIVKGLSTPQSVFRHQVSIIFLYNMYVHWQLLKTFSRKYIRQGGNSPLLRSVLWVLYIYIYIYVILSIQ